MQEEAAALTPTSSRRPSSRTEPVPTAFVLARVTLFRRVP